MKTTRLTTLATIALLVLAPSVFAKEPGEKQLTGAQNKALELAEEVHLLFMRAEEKLAHDVYEILGEKFPEQAVFSNIRDSETKHVNSMLNKLIFYNLPDPNALDGTGEFSDDNFGDHFTLTYTQLTAVEGAPNPLLQALKNGALIEELDMHDIVLCPDVIVEEVDEIANEEGCGMEYTDKNALVRSFSNLLDGSESHLRAFVRVLEAAFPEEYPYTAQYLSQEEVDEILGR